MTHDKAREFFSAYHEGTLEPGLVASLERDLRSDATLQMEYDAFVATVDSLDALRMEAIRVPAYLDARISSRLDSALATKRTPFWQALLAPRYGWAMGVAGALLVASVALRGLSAEKAVTAGFVPVGSDSVRWSGEGTSVIADFTGAAAHPVTVKPEGGEPTEYRLAAGQPLQLTLSNPNATARRFQVTLSGEPFATVAVPGRRSVPRGAGSGTVAELAGALADAYRITVVVKGAPMDASVRWSFDSVDPRVAAERSLDGHGSAAMMEGNVLQIGE